jgi:heme-degrading monooxygenase HmoA
MTEPVFVVVWEFDIRVGAEEAFLQAYGVDGEWARLFRRGTGFVRVELARSIAKSNRFFTFDYWVSREAFEAFGVEYATEYKTLDKKLTGLTERERRIGAFPSE